MLRVHEPDHVTETERRRSFFFQLRGILCLIIVALLVYHRQQFPFLLWILGAAYLASNILVRIVPASWFENPATGYGLFFIDMAGLTIVLHFTTEIGSASLLLIYLTVFMATLGQTVPRSIGIAFGTSAIYVWLLMTGKLKPLGDAESLFEIPLFFVTAVLCGYLAQEVQRHKRQIRGLRDIQTILELKVGSSSAALTESEDLRSAAQELAQRFRNLVEDLNAVVWEMDVPTFKITFINERAERLLGYPVERWLSEADFWATHVHPE